MIQKIYQIICDECGLNGIEAPLAEHYPDEIRKNMGNGKRALDPAFQDVDLTDKSAVKLRAKEIGWHVKREIYCPTCVRNLGLFDRKEKNGISKSV